MGIISDLFSASNLWSDEEKHQMRSGRLVPPSVGARKLGEGKQYASLADTQALEADPLSYDIMTMGLGNQAMLLNPFYKKSLKLMREFAPSRGFTPQQMEQYQMAGKQVLRHLGPEYAEFAGRAPRVELERQLYDNTRGAFVTPSGRIEIYPQALEGGIGQTRNTLAHEGRHWLNWINDPETYTKKQKTLLGKLFEEFSADRAGYNMEKLLKKRYGE